MKSWLKFGRLGLWLGIRLTLRLRLARLLLAGNYTVANVCALYIVL